MDRNETGVARVTLVRETSHPEVYLAYGKNKFHVASPERMAAMGLRWDKVEVVPDGSLTDLATSELGTEQTRPSQVFFSNNLANEPVPGWMNKDTQTKVSDDVLLAGWISQPRQHAEAPGGQGPWVEDIDWDLTLDVDFIERLYGPDGLSTRLVNAILPGHVGQGGLEPQPVPFGNLPPDALGRRYATVGAFAAPPLGRTLKIELNCWHVQEHVGGVRILFPPEFYLAAARGQAPAGWVRSFLDTPVSWGLWTGVIDDCWWPWDPFKPDVHTPLGPATPVLMCGTLWQDIGHDSAHLNDWDLQISGQGGWLEMHPPDWIHSLVVDPPARTYRDIWLPDRENNARSVAGTVPLPQTRSGQVPVTCGDPVIQTNHRYDGLVDTATSLDHISATRAADGRSASFDASLRPNGGSKHLYSAVVVVDWTYTDKSKEKEKEGKESKDKDGKDKDGKDNAALHEKGGVGREQQVIGSAASGDYASERSPEPDVGNGTVGGPDTGQPRDTFISPGERPTVQPPTP